MKLKKTHSIVEPSHALKIAILLILRSKSSHSILSVQLCTKSFI